MTIIPLRDRVIVRRLSEDELIEQRKTKGGIIVPDTAKEKPLQGQVLAVGDGMILGDGNVIALAIKEGDNVLFEQDTGHELVIEGEEVLIMHEDDILGVVKK